jgi:hypothetical protein
MARSATAFISQDEVTGDLFLQAQLEGGMKLPRRTRGEREQSIQVSVENAGFTSDPMPSPVRENTKFMAYDRLKELLAHPEQSKRLRGLLNEFIRDDQQREYLTGVADQLIGEGFYRFDAGGETYVLELGGAKVEVRPNKLVIGTLDGPALENPPSLRITGAQGAAGEQGALRVVGREITLRASPRLESSRTGEVSSTSQARERRMNVELEFADATVSAGSVTTPRTRFERTFSVPMPQELRSLENRRVDDYAVGTGLASAERVLTLERQWLKLTNSITSEIHARASFSIACFVLVAMGCALGMMFRSGNFLSAFALSVLPAMLTILLIISGQHTCENVPWDLKNFKQNQLQFGLMMIWSGNLVIFLLGLVLHVRLYRQ